MPSPPPTPGVLQEGHSTGNRELMGAPGHAATSTAQHAQMHAQPTGPVLAGGPVPHHGAPRS